MKKKLLMAFIAVVAFVCLFTIAISAKTVTYEGQEIELVDNLGDPSWYTGNTALAIQDKVSIVILKDSDGNMKAYPSYYILKFGVDVKDGAVTQAYVNGVDYSFVNEKASTSYESGSIYYIEFPYGMTKCSGNSIFGKDNDVKPEPNFVEVVIPNSVTAMDQQAFRRMNSCKKITLSKNIKSIPSWAFCGSTKLETVVFPDGSLLESTGNSFSNCTSLSSINLEACTNLKTLGGSAFAYCTSLRKLALPDSIETIESQAFYRIGEIELASDYLPKNLKTLGTHFMSGNKVINEVLYFPAGFTDMSASYHFNDGYTPNTTLTLVFLGKMTNVNLGNFLLADVTNNGSKKPLTIVFAQNTFDELNGTFIQGVDYNGTFGYIYSKGDATAPYTVKADGALTLTLNNNDPNSEASLGTNENGDKIYNAEIAPANIIFCGGETVEQCYSVRTNDTDKGWFRFFTTERTYDIEAHKTAGVHYDKIIVVNEVNCGYDGLTKDTCVICDRVIETIVSATGDHEYTVDSDCSTAHSCTVCEKEIVSALSHQTSFTIAYESGYISVGNKTTFCTNEGCAHKIVEVAPALFVSVGYSSSEYLAGTIVHTVIVNKNAILAYEENSGKTVEYGVVAAIHADGKPVEVTEDGTIVGRGQSIIAKMTNADYTRVEVKLIGVGAGIEVNCNAYIVVDGKVRYICGEEVLETAVSKTI